VGEKVRLYQLPPSVYWRSSTMLGTLYSWEKQRWSFADIERAVLEREAEVVIVAAPPHLIMWAEDQIAALQAGT
jgi:hypothetical protein